MIRIPLPLFLAVTGAACCMSTASSASPGRAPGSKQEPLRLVTIDPGHFHAALIQKEMLPGISPLAAVYAPVGPDVVAHLARIARFNARRKDPTHWRLQAYLGPDFLEKMLERSRGTRSVVVLSGRNRRKIEYIEAAVSAGLHVLADKPWIIKSADLPRLEAVLEAARESGVVVYDAMTQRYEISCILQRELVNDPAVFGTILEGTASDPAVILESVHHIIKAVAGAPLRRPAWFFDTSEQGEGLADVGTHLVDLVHWTLFPDAALDYRRDIRLTDALHWPTPVSKDEFTQATGEADFPPSLAPNVVNDRLRYCCNNTVDYTARKIHVRLDVRWQVKAPPGGGDTEVAVYRGSRARVEVRQGGAAGPQPRLYVVPAGAADVAAVQGALQARLAILEDAFPGLSLRDGTSPGPLAARRPDGFEVVIPDALRVGHEAHFALLAKRFLEYVKAPRSMPRREALDMLAKYRVTTGGVELARAREEARK